MNTLIEALFGTQQNPAPVEDRAATLPTGQANPMTSAVAGQNADKPFDLMGLASDLFSSSEEDKKKSKKSAMGMATNLTPHSGAGVKMPSAPQPMAQPMQQPMAQPQNVAMQAVTQGFNQDPRFSQFLQTLGYGR